MAKKINQEQIVDSLERLGEFGLPKGSCTRDIAAVRRMLEKGDSLLSPGRHRIWRAIMTSRWTRYGSAAAIAVAAVVGMVLLDGTKLSAEELLIRVSQNMSEVAWVKGVSRTYRPGEDEPVSTDTHLTDLRNRRVFLTYDAGYLHEMDYNKMRWSVYRPEDNTMIVKKLSGEWMGPETQVEQFIEKLRNEGLEVRESTETVDGVEMRVIEYDETLNNLSQDPNGFMSKMLMGKTPVKTIRMKLVINEERLWLSSAEIRYFDAADELIVTIKSTAEPLETGPSDIYELGAPRNAKVDNKVPVADVEEVRAQIREHQKRFLKNYVAIQIESRVENGTEQPAEAMVIYGRDNKIRVDVFSPLYPNSADLNEQRKDLLKKSLDRLEPFWSGSKPATVRSVRIYDGLWQHILDKREDELVLRKPQRRPDGDMYGDDDLDDFGWRTLWWLNEPEHMYTDEFSSDNGLVAMELTSQWTGQRLPKRQVLYVDPSKDYLFRRYSNEELLDASWQIEKIDPDDIEKDKARLREEEVRVFDVTEYAQTSAGQWYPRTIEITGFDRTVGPNGYRSDRNRVSRIYLLEENPDLPDSLFDPEALN